MAVGFAVTAVTKTRLRIQPDEGLCREIVEGFEVSVLVLDLACRRVQYANASARALLGSFGASGAVVPRALAASLSAWLASEPPQPRFRASLALATPNGDRHYARAKLLDGGEDRLLLVLSPHVLRERDLRQGLQERFHLSAREGQVIQCLRAGLSNSEIAARMGLTVGTIKNYLSQIFTALGVRSRTQLLTSLQSLDSERS